jgi:hypothetical protein
MPRINDDSDDRFRLIEIPEQSLLQLLIAAGRPRAGDCTLLPVLPDLPEGYRVADVFHDSFLNRFVFRVCHPSFERIDSTKIWGGIPVERANWRSMLFYGREC